MEPLLVPCVYRTRRLGSNSSPQSTCRASLSNVASFAPCVTMMMSNGIPLPPVEKGERKPRPAPTDATDGHPAAGLVIAIMELRSGAKLWNEIRGQQPRIEDAEQARYFEEGVRLVLARWTALGLAVEHGWGGPDSVVKSQSFQLEVYRWFVESKEQKYVDELEDFLEDVMVSDFNTELQDGSPRQVAEALVKLYEQCAVGDFSTVERMRSTLEDGAKSAKSQSRRIEEHDHCLGSNPGTTSSPNDETNDVDMDVEDIPTLDPEGWEVVTNNKKKGRDRKKCHE